MCSGCDWPDCGIQVGDYASEIVHCRRCRREHERDAHRRMARCTDCKEAKVVAYLFEGKCERCANINKPCVYQVEPRGAFGLAEGWCATHNKGWKWCEHSKRAENV